MAVQFTWLLFYNKDVQLIVKPLIEDKIIYISSLLSHKYLKYPKNSLLLKRDIVIMISLILS